VAILVHEITHVLGFSSGLYGSFRDANNVQLGDSKVYSSRNVLPAPYTKTVNVVFTPKALAAAQAYFGCSTITGLELEDGGGGGTAGSHWEKRIMEEDWMCGIASTFPIYSNITMSFLEDMGWYLTDKSKVNLTRPTDLGRNEGCSFVNKACASWPTDISGVVAKNEWVQVGGQFCTPNRLYKGTSTYSTTVAGIPTNMRYFASSTTGGYDSYADYCPRVQGYQDGNCRPTNSSASTAWTGYREIFGPSSMCLISKKGSTSHPSCYNVQCGTSPKYTVEANGGSAVCDGTAATVTISDITITCDTWETMCLVGTPLPAIGMASTLLPAVSMLVALLLLLVLW
jgi:hypothetical protein